MTLKDDFKLSQTQPTAYIDDGLKPVYKLTTRLGRSVETTTSHPFLTFAGWKKLSEISVGTKVAVPRIIPIFGNKIMRECEIKLLNVWPKPAERSERQREDEDRRQDDAPGWQAIEQKPYAWRNESDGNRREGEGAADGFSLPAERRMQRTEEETEGVRNDRSEAHHHACKGGDDHRPSGIVKGTFV